MNRGIRCTAATLVLVVIAGCGSDEEAADLTSESTVPRTSAPITAPPMQTNPPPTGEVGRPPSQDELEPPMRPTVCLLLAFEEVTAIVPDAVSSEEGMAIDDQVTCRYLDASGAPLLGVSLTGPSHEPPPAEMLAEALDTDGAESHTDIGDGAVVTDGVASVLVGDQLLTVRPFGDNDYAGDDLLTLAAAASDDL
jgi:hypothetical protein